MTNPHRTVFDLREGEELRPVEFTLSPEVAGYTCVAVGDRHPWLINESPFGGPIIPPVDVQFCSQRQIVNHLVGKPTGALFQSKAMLLYVYEAEYHDPARVGENVSITGRCARRYRKRAHDYIDFAHEIHGKDGRLIARYRASYAFGSSKGEE